MRATQFRRAIPWGMIVLRTLGCPLIVMGAWWGWPGVWLATFVLLALLSDVYDGILARRWGGETPALRVSDSIADSIFYGSVVDALWIREPQVIRCN
jgi:phosphatidylglycerophosphate synthase